MYFEAFEVELDIQNSGLLDARNQLIMRGQGSDMNFLLRNVHVPHKSLYHVFVFLCSKKIDL